MVGLGLSLQQVPTPPQPATPPPSATDDVSRIVQQVRQEARQRELADRAAALEFLEKAEQARREGQLARAQTLARQAQALFPESLVIARWLTDFEAQGRPASRDQRLNWRLAMATLHEANDLIEKLISKRQHASARAWLDAVSAAAARFPPSPELEAALSQVRKLQQRLDFGTATPEAAESRQLMPPARELLNKKMDVQWIQTPALDALQQIADATGVTFTIDPDLARRRILEQQPLTVSIRDFPAERLLRVVAEVTLTEAVLLDQGQVLITTKPKALAMALQPRRDLPIAPRAGLVAGAERSTPSQIAPRAAEREQSPPAEQKRDDQVKVEAQVSYLKSPDAFLRYINDLLAAPAAEPASKPQELPPE
jgi:hypothetical protein